MFSRRQAAAFVLSAALITSCGDGRPASKEAYCEIETMIDDEFGRTFESLGDTPTDEQRRRALVSLAQRIDGEHRTEALAAAPSAIRADVNILFAAIRRAANGDTDALDMDDVNRAAERVDTFCFGQ